MNILDIYGDVLHEITDDNLPKKNFRFTNLPFAELCYADFQDADLRFADLRNADLKHANLQYADLRYADLCYADLQFTDLCYANLRNAKLGKTRLCNAKLKGALLPHLGKTPTVPNIHKAVYEAAWQPNALEKVTWNTYGTSHYWAGLVITLAGEAGRALESKIGTDVAAGLIYMKSDPNLEKIPNWYASGEEMLADMRRLAESNCL